MKIDIKDNKIRVRCSNIYMNHKHIRLNSYSWWSNPKGATTGGFSTTKIPTDVPKKRIEVHYPRKIKEKYCIFPSLNEKMNKVFDTLNNSILEDDDNW